MRDHQSVSNQNGQMGLVRRVHLHDPWRISPSLTRFLFLVAAILCKEMSNKRSFQNTFADIFFGFNDYLSLHYSSMNELLFPLIHFSNDRIQTAWSVCVCCSGARTRFRTMLPCSSHITVLSYKTSWWHGFSQGQTLSSISIYQIPCWLRRTMI